MNIAQVARLLLVAPLLACSNSASVPQTTAGAVAPATGSAGAAQVATSAAASGKGAQAPSASALEMPPLEAGYKRFIASAVEVPSGTTDDWIQWVEGPVDQDYDVIALKGAQSKGGHHALLLATTEAQANGVTRKYTERDQLTSSSLGGVGAEGNVAIPEGVVFRLRKGSYLAIQAHYLNTTEEAIQGETYIDLKMTPKDPSHTVAGHFASTTLKIALPPKAETSLDVTCPVEQDLQILRMTNHMHYAGLSTYTEYTDPSGKAHLLKQDDVWSEDWALAPNYDNFPVSAPLVIPAGSTIHTRCTWNNSTDKMLGFPEEMCVFATVILGEKEISCIDGKFSARTSEPTSAAASGGGGSAAASGAAGAAAVSGAPGVSAAASGASGAAGPVAGAAGAAGAAAAPADPAAASGACTNAGDKAVLDAADFQDQQRNCGRMCFGAEESCATDCLTKNTTLTPACAACNGEQITCGMANCVADCTDGFMSATCKPCLEVNCAAYHTCSGL